MAESDFSTSEPYQGTPSLNRVMPQNLDAEKAVLAAMILSRDVAEEVLGRLEPASFYRPAHQKIFESMGELYERNEPIDQLTLADRLQARGDLEAVGGKPYIIELASNAFATANWPTHCDIVKRCAMLRDLIKASTRITALAYDAPDDLDEVVEESEKLIMDVTNRKVESNFKEMPNLLMDTYGQLEEMAKQQTHLMGVPTGFKDLDEMLAGLRSGDLIIVAARPAVGNSSLALNIAVNAAKAGCTVAVFSLEMDAEQITQRVLCSEALVNLGDIRAGRVKDSDWQALIDASNRLYNCNIAIDDTPGASILEIRAKARRRLRNVERGKGLVIVDYLQLMQPQSRRSNVNREQEVAEMSRGLKILAKELNQPVIALSQLSRAVESRTGHRPQLSDLRESGSIEQDADIVMFIDRVTDPKDAGEGRPELGTADIIVAKHRNGEVGTKTLSFADQFTKFQDLARVQP